jgi:hypothetical protein
MDSEAGSKEVTVRLPKEIAQQIRDVFDPESGWEVL